MTYVRIRSWHVISTWTRIGGVITRCGQRIDPPVPHRIVLPLGERSCETCLRLTAHDAEPQS